MRKTVLILTPILILAFFVSIWLCQPPRPLSMDVDLALFSAGRAMKHVRDIAQKPHTMGTQEHARVRDYIVGHMSSLGYLTEVQESSVLIPHGHSLIGGMIRNVVSIQPGLIGDQAIMVVGHYDTQPNTLGAADDTSAVAAMLEAARALKLAGPIKNDLIFLFSDAEEIGMVGAEAFVREHSLAKKVGLVLNLEARGNSGVAFTFETSARNGWIMEEYAKAVKYPFAGSVMYEIYKRMPNNTDFTVFKEAGYSGFNAAYVEGFVNYHAMTDTPEMLDQGSLQHHGEYIVDIVNHFGGLDLNDIKAEDRVFFNPAGSWLLVIPSFGQDILLAVVLGLMLLVAFLALYRKRVSIFALFGGLLVYPLALVFGLFVVWLAKMAFVSLYPLSDRYYAMNLPSAVDFFWVFAALALLGFLLIYRLLQKKINVEAMTIGALLVLTALGVALFFYIPTGAYALLYPLFLPLIIWALILVFDIHCERKPWLWSILVFVSLLPAIFFLTPMVKMMFVVFSIQMIIAAAVLLLILAGLGLPWLSQLSRFAPKTLGFTLLLTLLIALTMGHLRSKPSPERPLHSNLCYFMDADSGQALWASRFLEPDVGNRDYFNAPKREPLTEIFAKSRLPFLKQKAPTADLPPFIWEVMADGQNSEGQRLVCARLSSPRGATVLQLMAQTTPTLLALQVDGKAVALPDENVTIDYHGLPAEGIELSLTLVPGQAFEMTVLELSWGLPDLPDTKPLPAEVIPSTGYFSRATIVKRTIHL